MEEKRAKDIASQKRDEHPEFSWVANKIQSLYGTVFCSEPRAQVERQRTGEVGHQKQMPSLALRTSNSLIKQDSVRQVSAFSYNYILHQTVCLHSSFFNMNLIPILICNRKDAPSPLALHECGKRGHTSGYNKVFLHAYIKVYVFKLQMECN